MDPTTNSVDRFRVSTSLGSTTLSLLPNAPSDARLKYSDQPWPFAFLPGDIAWAKGRNGRWRRVRVVDAGQPEIRGIRLVIWYTVSWKREGVEFRELFCPVQGNLKPDMPSVREVLFKEEGVLFQAQWWWIDGEPEYQSEDDRPTVCVIA